MATDNRSPDNSLRIAIIGAGPGGLGAGYELLKQGFSEFTIFDKSAAVGGTWHNHSYPGLACDVWAHSYTFSYAPNPDWSASFVEQKEIEQYLQNCATQFGLDPHIVLNTNIVKAEYQPEGCWRLTTESGDTHEFDVIINAMGNQHTPLLPDIEGINSFQGESWHSTEWNHNVELAGKKIAVVGSAAAAVQIVPEIAKVAGHLSVLQRTPNWIMSRGRKPYSERQRKWFRRFPLLMTLTKKFQGLLMSFVIEAATIGHKRMDQFENTAKKFIEDSISDPVLRQQVTPNSRYACKRGLVSDDFYPALQRDNVELIPEGLAEVKANSIVLQSGREIEVDIIVYCTGYEVLDYDRIDVSGENGKSLARQMENAPEAYKGIAAPGFPNYFFAIGPNGLVLNVSYFITMEQNLKTIVRLLKEKQQSGAKAIAVKSSVSNDYNQWMNVQSRKFAWGDMSCHSYYSTESGHIPFLFPGSFKEYVKIQGQCSLQDFDTVA